MVLSLFDFILLIINLILITALACYYNYANDKIKRLEASLKEHEKRLKERPSELVSQVFQDFQNSGFTLLRIDSKDILYRSPRG